MYSLACLVHLEPGAGSGVWDRLTELGGAVATVLEGSFNGGDISAHFAFPGEADYHAAKDAIFAALTASGVVRADTAFYARGKQGIGAPALATGVHRTLLLCADHRATSDRIAQFERETQLMPKYIPAIRNWRLSPVIEATGELGWTHVWEQEYEGAAGLMGPYMLHPYHWAWIDRWFDPECPDWLVNTRLCHSYAAYGLAIIG